jgi:hypothetical protein
MSGNDNRIMAQNIWRLMHLFERTVLTTEKMNQPRQDTDPFRNHLWNDFHNLYSSLDLYAVPMDSKHFKNEVPFAVKLRSVIANIVAFKDYDQFALYSNLSEDEVTQVVNEFKTNIIALKPVGVISQNHISSITNSVMQSLYTGMRESESVK